MTTASATPGANRTPVADGAGKLDSGWLPAIAGATLDTDGTLAANSDTRVATQKATKTYVDTETAARIAADATKQPLDATLTALAGLATGADKLAYSSGTDTFAQTDLTAAARTILDDTTVAAMVDTLGGASSTGSGGLARLNSPALLGTPTAPTAGSGTNSTQVATTAFVTAALSLAVSGLLENKGDLSASGNPNYPAASNGDAYYITVAGKVGGGSGKSVDIGDLLICKADNAGGTEASVGTSWYVLEKNLVGALLAANNLSDLGNPDTALTNLGGAAYTGTGGVVRATGATLVAPILGTPASGVGTNITGVAAGLTSGITQALKSATTTVDVSAATAPTAGQALIALSGTAASWQNISGAVGTVPGGRLTLTPGVAVSPLDVVGASAVYYDFYKNNAVRLWDTAAWTEGIFTRLTDTLSGLTTGAFYNEFLYFSSPGVVAMQRSPWPTATVTISNASPGVISWTSHGLLNGDMITFTTSGALPTGLTPRTTYFVVNKTTNTLEVSAIPGGSSINTSDAGSGTHTALAQNVQYQDGRMCKSDDKTKLLVGSFMATSSTTTDDRAGGRLLSNCYNREPRLLYIFDTGAYTTSGVYFTFVEMPSSRVYWLNGLDGLAMEGTMASLNDGGYSITGWMLNGNNVNNGFRRSSNVGSGHLGACWPVGCSAQLGLSYVSLSMWDGGNDTIWYENIVNAEVSA